MTLARSEEAAQHDHNHKPSVAKEMWEGVKQLLKGKGWPPRPTTFFGP